MDLRPGESGGTAIHWRVSYYPKIPGTGWLLRRALTRFMTANVRGLASYAATRWSTR